MSEDLSTFDTDLECRKAGLKPQMVNYFRHTKDIYRRGTICSNIGFMAPSMAQYNKYSQIASMLLDRYYAYEEQRKKDASPLLRVRT